MDVKGSPRPPGAGRVDSRSGDHGGDNQRACRPEVDGYLTDRAFFVGKRSGFTLLEMIMVLVIIAILAGLALPSFQSAITENAMRKDTHQLALMVKTAMLQSADQNRAYMIELSPTEIALHPVGEAAADPDADADSNGSVDAPTTNNAPVDVVVTSEIDPANHLQVPDPVKANAWMAMPPTQWVFEPGELCPATRVRFSRGEGWIEMGFAPLTGNVLDEKFSLP
jgi:prepilin-type N-terminal cleavage/methylation domain-containing protein